MPRRRKRKELKPGEKAVNLIDAAIEDAATEIANAKFRINQDQSVIKTNTETIKDLAESRAKLSLNDTGGGDD